MLITRNANPGSEWNMVMGIAFLLAVAMMGLAGGVVRPALRKLAAMPAPPANAPAGPPPADVLAVQKRLMMASMAGTIMGAVAVFLMVYATKLRVY